MARLILIIIVAFAEFCEVCSASPGTDEEIRRRIVGYLKPRCGGHLIPGVTPRRPELIDRIELGGDTNRLARILAELAQTNDVWYAERAMGQLEKYASSEQLPFLYSCATNPAVGDRAVRTVARICGVNSNTIDVARSYLMSTNEMTRDKQGNRSQVCEDLLRKVYGISGMTQYRPQCMALALDFARDINTMHISLDVAIQSVDSTYRYSKRRLAIMRAAEARCVNTGLYAYVTNAINELVAYPEANLPD